VADSIDEKELVVEEYVPMLMLSIPQSLRFQRMVDEGQYASFDEAVAAHRDELQFEKVGDDWYSAEAKKRIEDGIAEALRGEFVDGEEVMAKFDALLRELEARQDE
jgi:predicted transcriptional regulator